MMSTFPQWVRFQASSALTRFVAVLGYVLLLANLLFSSMVLAQSTPQQPTAPTAPAQTPSRSGLQPFGASLFAGNFLHSREDGVNADYVIMPGDQVAVYAWGAVDINKTYIVDTQGNIFLPEIGPIKLAGIQNKELTKVVRRGLGRVYTRFFNVYTNLLTAKPVGVFVTGGVRRPGRYAGVPSDSILFFLDQAGGIDPDLGSYRAVEILRSGKTHTTIDLYDFLLAGTLHAEQFQEGDVVLVKQRGPVVELRGDVAAPSLLEFKPGTIVGSQALGVIAGSARATSVTVFGLRHAIPFNRTLSLAEFQTTTLQHGDRIELRADLPSPSVLINIEGETQGPSQLSIVRGARLVDVLNYIAVDPELADIESVHLKRKSVAQAQKDSIEDSLFRLERSALLALSSSSGESAIRVQEAELTRKFVERARLIQPLGRVVTSTRGAQQNLRLEPGDTIVIPRRTAVIRVGGEVLMSQAVMYQVGLVAEDYINQSGGYTGRADEDKVIVMRANAQVVIGDLNSPIYPGDEILVPPEVDTKALQNFADVTQIIYQIAVAAAVVIAL